jgi:hypothetical protein
MHPSNISVKATCFIESIISSSAVSGLAGGDQNLLAIHDGV